MSIAQNWLAGISAGRQHRMQDEAIAKQNRLGQLAGQAFGAAHEQRGGILSQVAEVDPESAFAMQDRFSREDQSAEQAKHARLTNMAKMLAAAPEPMRGGLYAQMVPSLRGMGLQAPDAWDDSLMGVVQSLAGTQGDNFRPMVVAPGSALVDPRRGVLFQNPAKAERFPIVNVPDGNGGTIAMRDTPQGLMPLSAGFGAPAAPSAPDLPYRVNIQGLQPESVQQARAMIEQDIGRPLNDAEWAQVSGNAMRPVRTGGFGVNPAPTKAQFVDMTPEQIRAAGLPEGTVAQRNPETHEIKTVRAPDAGTLKEQREIRARAPRLNAVVRSLSNIQSAFTDLEAGKSTFGLAGTGPVDQLVAGFTPEGDRMNQAVSELQANLMALTRVPGIGTQSDLETRLDSLRYPSTARLEGSNRQSIQSLALFINDLAEAYEVAGDEATASQVRAIRPQLQRLIDASSPSRDTPATSPAAPSASGFRILSQRPAGG